MVWLVTHAHARAATLASYYDCTSKSMHLENPHCEGTHRMGLCEVPVKNKQSSKALNVPLGEFLAFAVVRVLCELGGLHLQQSRKKQSAKVHGVQL